MSLTNLQKKKLQIELNPKKDKTVYQLVEKLEVESEGEKGYVNKQIKRRLEMYQILSEVAGEDDPVELVKKILMNMQKYGGQHKMENDEPASNETVDNAMGLINGLGNW
ncbi:peptidylprolyl isomerase [Bacillus thuringiensis]|uniref:peptidylprolyl isomerase n=1 Tax=Bacillus thuringiensis TaxID=1428 RepID=UPI003B9823BD